MNWILQNNLSFYDGCAETTATLATLDLELENWKQKCLNMEDRINKITDEKSKLVSKLVTFGKDLDPSKLSISCNNKTNDSNKKYSG